MYCRLCNSEFVVGRRKRYIKNQARSKRRAMLQPLYLQKRKQRDVKRRNKFHHYYNQSLADTSALANNSAPEDFRLLVNTRKCCDFFNRLRRNAHKTQSKGINQVIINFRGTNQIDFASVQVLNAICEELKASNPKCAMRGFLPIDPRCRQFLVDSGFLEGKVNEYGIQFQPSRSTSKMKIAVGQSLWTDADGKRAGVIAHKTGNHLHGKISPNYITIIIKEICGNSVEWGNSKHKQWVLAAKFDNKRVEYVALDLGEGILKTIHRDFWQKVQELGFSTDADILWNAFDKKYFSHSEDPNRHKGLPQIKSEFVNGRFQELYVLSNGVMLNFASDSPKSNIGKTGFKGTLYRWVITPECMNI